MLASAQTLLADLRDFRSRIQEIGDVTYAQHGDFAERAISLETYLASALERALAGAYMPAFALLRSALEHHLVDRLLFLADTYKTRIPKFKRTDYDSWHADWQSGKPGTENIISLEWKSKPSTTGTVEVVRTGPHPTEGQTVSIYYLLLQEFDPFVGRPDEQQFLVREFGPLGDHQQYAEEQRRVYGSLKWDEIKSNLLGNQLCNAKTLLQFEVHYRFLSAFVHPWPAALNLVYGRNRPRGVHRYDHYSSELLLLYINHIAAAELRALGEMAGRTPRIGLADWSSVVTHIQSAEAAANHLWFPGGEPHQFDRVKEANSRAWYGSNAATSEPPMPPDQITDDEVGYYRDPFTRLIRMHTSLPELVGFTYISPWPRVDALSRLAQT